MPTNGTLKYKQDDGSIVELNPAGVDAEARALVTAETARAKAAEQKLENDKADKTAIPDVSALVTKETYNAGQAAQDAKITALENVAPDKLPYEFGLVSFSSIVYDTESSNSALISADLPWMHSKDYYGLTASLPGSPKLYIINLVNGSVQTVTSGITATAVGSSSTPYHVTFQIEIPGSFSAGVPYLVGGKVYTKIT